MLLAAALIVWIGLTRPAQAESITLAWDAPPLVTGITNYTLYAHTNDLAAGNLAEAVVVVRVGTNRVASLFDLMPGRWTFVTTCTANGVESLPSKAVLYEVQNSPRNLRTVAVQYGTTLTNFFDVGFFRLRIP